MNESIKSGTFVFRPRARLIKTIGEELISDDKVAILELVKNSYDAYCTLNDEGAIVDITFNGNVQSRPSGEKYIAKEHASIIIYDEGIGMDFEVIRTAWMEPATNFKKLKQNQNPLNPLKKYAGEKGIGRFASAKLASKLELITKQAGKDEIFIKFNWNDFSNEYDYLDDIKIEWEIRPATEIQNHGTILRLYDLNEDWSESKIKDLRVALSRLLNPIVPIEDFLMSLNLPKEFESLSGTIERPETLNRPNYSIKGRIAADGSPQQIVFYSKAIGHEEILSLNENEFRLPRKYLAGPFSFEFKIWNRDTDELKALANETGNIVKNVKTDLDELCGISIYRDNIRVLPYGNKNNDWVRLDMRRVNNPTLRLSNNQIVGYIAIGIYSNQLLQDPSNREGIVESQAFEDIKDYIKLILNEVEQRRYAERPREYQKKSTKSLFDAFSLVSISATIQETNPNLKEILDLIGQKEIEIKQSIIKVQEILSRYRRLSTLGQLVDPIIHDGRNFLNKIDLKSEIIIQETQKEICDIKKIGIKINEIQTIRKEFAQLFKRIEPFGGRKQGRPETITIEDAISNIFTLNRDELSKSNITYHLPDTCHRVTIDESELGLIFMNLIQNSIYWLNTIKPPRIIEVNIIDESDGLSIIFSDNGPGIKHEIEDRIFEPYFSTKPDGIGLGLAIIGELMADYNGELALIESMIGGASFKLKFKYRV